MCEGSLREVKKDGLNAQTLLQVTRQIGLMVTFKNGVAIITLLLNDHIGHRPLTQCVQPMDRKGFWI